MNGMDIQQGNDSGLRELALFAGAGGGILGGHLLGWRTVCAVEWDAYAASVLVARQNDGCFPPFPVWDDVRTFDGRPWRGIVEVVSGGFPCQDISVAGKGDGLDGERSGLWREMARIIREVGPRFVFVENSPVLTSRGLGVVLGDLAAMGYNARWGVLGADDAGAPHRRKRIWIRAELPDADDHRLGLAVQQVSIGGGDVPPNAGRDGSSWALADADRLRELQQERLEQGERGWFGDGGQDVADADLPHGEGMRRTERGQAQRADAYPSSSWWGRDPAEDPESGMGRASYGVAD